MRTPRSKAAFASLGGRVRVAARDRDLARAAARSIELARPGSSGASVTSRTGPAVEQPLEQLEVGVAARGRRVGAEPRRAEGTALRDARRGCAARRRSARHLAERGEELLLGGRDERRQVRGDAGLEQRLAGLRGSRRRRRRGSRRRRSRSPGGRRSRARRCRGRSRDARPTPATRPSMISTSPGTSVPSTSAASTPSLTSSSASATLPSAAVAAASRAVVGVDPREQRHDRDLARRRPRGERGVDLVAAARPSPARRSGERGRWSLSFVATTSTMRFPNVFPSRTIEIVEIVLRTSFCAVPAFRRVEPARNSGPTTTAISWSTSAPSCESGDARRRTR